MAYHYSFTPQPGEAKLLLALFGLYATVYGWFIYAANGLPYVLDNNESFSSLWHASNLFRYGLGESFGITDESYGAHAAAHPYVYTHQGNFPRIFALLIYAMGARTAESQIIVTTFTVGAAALGLAYKFFARSFSPIFAFTACVLLFTDYLLVAQWQVVTYRVWHAFFVFSSLLCVIAAARGTRFWPYATVLNFACLFYFEFVFVAFVSIATAIYAAFVLSRSRKLLQFVTLQGLGAAIGLSVLLLQLVLYMGWDNVVRDAYLTFVARNRYLKDPGLLGEMKEFFDSKNIVFWYNLVDGSYFRSLGYFAVSLTVHEFQIHTPLFTLVTVTLVTGLVIGFSRQAYIPLGSSAVASRRETHGPTLIYVAVPILLSSIHLGHRLWRNDFGFMQVSTALGILLIAVVTIWMLRHSLGSAFVRPGVIDGDDSLLRATAASAGTAVLLITIPTLILHQSVQPSTGEQYSSVFIWYLLVFSSALVWTLGGALVEFMRHRKRSGLLMRWTEQVLAYALLGLSMFGLLIATVPGEWAFGINRVSLNWSRGELLFLGVAVVCIVGISGGWFTYRRLCSHRDALHSHAHGLPRAKPLVSAALLLGLFAAVCQLNWAVYHQRYAALWEYIMALGAPGLLRYVFLYLSIGVAILLALSGAYPHLTQRENQGLKLLGIFVLSGLIAYCVVFFLSPGYVFTGYRFRYAPITVFHTNAIASLALFTLVLMTTRHSPEVIRSASFVAFEPRRRIRSVNVNILRVVGALMLVGLAWYWISIQYTYLHLLPPNSYDFLRKLEQAPYQGKSFIVNNYAAPIASATGEWAYLHAALTEGRLAQKGGTYVVEMDGTYLWLADKDKNATYQYPDYFICITPQSLPIVINRLNATTGQETGPVGCAEHPLVRVASGRDSRPISPKVRLVEMDYEGAARLGFERWAIVELLWETKNTGAATNAQ